MKNNITCQCCKQQRAKLEAKQSRLVESMNFICCSLCRKAEHEPRYILVLAAKSGKNVSEHVKNHKYCGKSLEAVEILP